MQLWTYWLAAAFIVVAVEMFAGTFYLLMMAAALCGTALYTLLFDAGMQSGLFVWSLLSGIGMAAAYRIRKAKRSLANEDDMDVGNMVQVERQIAGGHWRVQYRGAIWEARSAHAEQFQAGDSAKICGKDGIVLLIEAV